MRTTDLFKFNRSPKRLNESLQKTFGTKINFEDFDTAKLEDARNKLRTQIHTARSGSSFNEDLENEILTKAQFMHDAIVAELMDRQEHIVDTTPMEGSSVDVQAVNKIISRFDQNMNEIGGYGDPDYKAAIAALEQGDVETAIGAVVDTYSDQDGGEVRGIDAYIDDLQDDFEYLVQGEKGVAEGAMKDIDYDLRMLADDGDEDQLIGALQGEMGSGVADVLNDMMSELQDELASKGMNDVMNDNDKMIEMLMDKLVDEYSADNWDDGGETDDNYALASAGHGSDEDYGDFPESMGERVRDPEDWDEGNTEPPNNFAVSINGKKWKVFKGRGQYADDQYEKAHFYQLKDWARKKSEATGKKWDVSITGENPTESVQTELSTNTLKSYQDKAGKDIVNTMTSGDYMTTDKSAKKVMNRMKGSEKADNKIYKRENESIEQTGDDMRNLREGEIQQASAIVTAKTMVDRVGRWIEELSGMENDTLLQLGDSIRDEMSQEQAKAFIEAVAPAIQQALETLKGTRDTLSSGVRSLASGEQPTDMLGAEPGADMAEPDAMNAEPVPGVDAGAEDEFAAAEPAAGGIETAGREQRESIDRQSRLMKILAG